MKVWNGTGSRGGTGRVVVVDGDESWLCCFSNSFTIKLLGQSVCVTIRWLLLLFFVFQTGCASKRCSFPARIDDILLVLFLSCVLNRTRDGIHLSSKQQCVYTSRCFGSVREIVRSERPSVLCTREEDINQSHAMYSKRRCQDVRHVQYVFVRTKDGRSLCLRRTKSITHCRKIIFRGPTDRCLR
jgi:hypothetical protein